MRDIDRTLQKLEVLIKENRFEQLETEKLELKDLSNSDNWKELYKSVCAFLNTEGGIVVVGINEKDNKYRFTKYNHGNESKLKELSKQFTNKDNEPQAFTEFFPSFEIKDFLDGQICLIFVEKLPEDQKYAFYNGTAYERVLTGDHKISLLKIESQEELKREISDARELKVVKGAGLEHLDIDKLNDYINRMNRDIKVESLKPDIATALPFLYRRHLVVAEKPTLLGMLVCGEHPFDWVGGRCEVDCYVDADFEVAKSKLVIKDNIIPLMEASVAFVFRNIAVGVGIEGGGTRLPEYPERLIREVINNALAHRDYHSDRFAIIVIKPNKHIEVRNPGSFRADQKLSLEAPQRIRRIIPNPKPRNPRLADILKAYERWEGRGLGMASLTNACLDNQIDVPYFAFRSGDEISLFIPKGKVLNEDAEQWLQVFSGWILRQTNGAGLTEEEKTVLTYFWKSEKLNAVERYTVMLSRDNNHFDVIEKLEKTGLIQKLNFPNTENSIHPVYIVNRIMTQEDFIQPLRGIFGGQFDQLGRDHKEVLQAIFQHNEYSLEEKVSAKAMGTFLYVRKNKGIFDFRDFDNFSRKVRSIVNSLEKKGYIVRADGQKPRFIVNKSFERTPSLFDNQLNN